MLPLCLHCSSNSISNVKSLYCGACQKKKPDDYFHCIKCFALLYVPEVTTMNLVCHACYPSFRDPVGETEYMCVKQNCYEPTISGEDFHCVTHDRETDKCIVCGRDEGYRKRVCSKKCFRQIPRGLVKLFPKRFISKCNSASAAESV